MVPTYADSYAQGGEFAQMADRVTADAQQLLTLAVVYERCRGVSWEIIGESLGISQETARERYAADHKRLDDELTTYWLTGDDPRFPGLPEGATDPAGPLTDSTAG